jgi:hypothetical protein
MVASDAFAEFLREQIAPLGRVTMRRLFGRTGVFCDGLTFGMVTDDTLYFRLMTQPPAIPKSSPLCRLSNLLGGMSVKRGVDGFDQIAFDQRRRVVASRQSNNDLELIRCATVEQHTRGRVCKHARIGPDKTTHLFNCGIEIGVVCNLKTYLACMWRGRINAEITQGLTPDAAVWHDHLHFVVGDQLCPE